MRGGASGEEPLLPAGWDQAETRRAQPGAGLLGARILPFLRPAPAPWRSGAPLRPSLRPQLGFPFAWGFLQAQYSSAEPRGPQRAG